MATWHNMVVVATRAQCEQDGDDGSWGNDNVGVPRQMTVLGTWLVLDQEMPGNGQLGRYVWVWIVRGCLHMGNGPLDAISRQTEANLSVETANGVQGGIVRSSRWDGSCGVRAMVGCGVCNLGWSRCSWQGPGDFGSGN